MFFTVLFLLYSNLKVYNKAMNRRFILEEKTTMNKEYVMKEFRLTNAKEIDCKKYVESFMSRDKEVDYFTGSTSNFESKTIENYYLNSLEGSSRYDFLIWSNDKVIGEVVLNEIDLIVMSAHFRIAIFSNDFYHKGIGKFATKSILDFAFNDLILKRVGLEVFDYNKRAIKLYEK